MQYLKSPNLVGTYSKGSTDIEILENYERTDCGEEIKFYTLRIIHENSIKYPVGSSAEGQLERLFESIEAVMSP